MSTYIPLKITRREDKLLTFTVHQLGGSPSDTAYRQDLTGAVAYFGWKDQHKDASHEVLKNSNDDPTEVIILTQSGSTLGQFTVEITNADTVGITDLGNKVGDVWVKLASGKRHQLKRLKITLEQEVVEVT